VLALGRSLRDISMFAAPTMVRRIVDRAKAAGSNGDGIRTIVYGGGPMYTADIEEAVSVLGPRFVQIYGQGESPMTITALSRALIADRRHPRWRERLGSVGRAQSCVQVRIADDDGQTLPTGESGEILVRGAPVMLGYWRNPEATANTIRDGWLWTGDIGAMDGDGFLTLKDRSKDVIISGGSNIYPREVEEALLLHPAVHEVSVVGRPSAEWGEHVVAFVVAKPGATLDPSDLDRHCLDHIARFKRPKSYIVEAELPKNSYGKVLKTELRARLAAMVGRKET
jgi:acyl-CoA synthetase (AMP-forming)/AMP-acid ligase II